MHIIYRCLITIICLMLAFALYPSLITTKYSAPPSYNAIHGAMNIAPDNVHSPQCGTAGCFSPTYCSIEVFSSGKPFTQTILQNDTLTTSFTVSPPTALYPIPTGNSTFTLYNPDTSSIISVASVPLQNGTATYSATTLPLGPIIDSVTYNGNSIYDTCNQRLRIEVAPIAPATLTPRPIASPPHTGGTATAVPTESVQLQPTASQIAIASTATTLSALSPSVSSIKPSSSQPSNIIIVIALVILLGCTGGISGFIFWQMRSHKNDGITISDHLDTQ
jgi:hypothetical protein